MALSMDEQRILAEIEQHLAQTEPALAARFSALGAVRAGRPSRRLLSAIATALLVAAVSLIVYGLVSLRGGHSPAYARHAPSSQHAPIRGAAAHSAP